MILETTKKKYETQDNTAGVCDILFFFGCFRNTKSHNRENEIGIKKICLRLPF